MYVNSLLSVQRPVTAMGGSSLLAWVSSSLQSHQYRRGTRLDQSRQSTGWLGALRPITAQGASRHSLSANHKPPNTWR